MSKTVKLGGILVKAIKDGSYKSGTLRHTFATTSPTISSAVTKGVVSSDVIQDKLDVSLVLNFTKEQIETMEYVSSLKGKLTINTRGSLGGNNFVVREEEEDE